MRGLRARASPRALDAGSAAAARHATQRMPAGATPTAHPARTLTSVALAVGSSLPMPSNATSNTFSSSRSASAFILRVGSAAGGVRARALRCAALVPSQERACARRCTRTRARMLHGMKAISAPSVRCFLHAHARVRGHRRQPAPQRLLHGEPLLLCQLLGVTLGGLACVRVVWCGAVCCVCCAVLCRHGC